MLPDNTTPRWVTIQNLRANTTYEFTVQSYDQTGNFSPASQPVDLTTPAGTDTVPPVAPPNLQVLTSWHLSLGYFHAVTEMFPMSKVNEALDHLRAGKARYRIVLKNDFAA